MPLYILPNTFSDEQSPFLLLPDGIPSILAQLDGLIAESERAGRRYLIKLLQTPLARSMPIYLLSEHSRDLSELVSMIRSGKRLGLISDAGMASIADPGPELVYELRKRGVDAIHAISGPSSITLALVLSGLGGQRFSFHGYLPREGVLRKKRLCQIEEASCRENSVQICIEAPYRNKAFFSDCLAVLNTSTELVVATRLTFEDQFVSLKTIEKWRLGAYVPPKEPAVFLLRARHGKKAAVKKCGHLR